MSNKIIVVGGNGFVGGVISTMAHRNWQVTVFDHQDKPIHDNIEFYQIDITDKDQLFSAVKEINPDVVVNVAAISKIDFAEKNQELTHSVNTEGAANIAESCNRVQSKFIHFSSDAVFDGEKDVYTEEDIPNPVNYYGKSKAESEQRVRDLHDNSVIVRISLVMGYPVKEGNAFFLALKKKLSNEQNLEVPENEIRTPVDVITLAEAVLELAHNDFKSTVHIGAIESINRYELSRRVASAMGFSPELIKSKSKVSDPNRAPRHKNGIISVSKAQKLLNTRMLSINEGIERAINNSY